MEEPHKCHWMQSECFGYILLLEFTNNSNDSEEGLRSSSITPKRKPPVTHSPFPSVSLELPGLVDSSCSSKALLMFSDVWPGELDPASDLCNCSSTACAIGTIMAVVAVLLIHMDKKAVTTMKPMRSLTWKGLEKSVQNSALWCPFFIAKLCLQSFWSGNCLVTHTQCFLLPWSAPGTTQEDLTVSASYVFTFLALGKGKLGAWSSLSSQCPAYSACFWGRHST